MKKILIFFSIICTASEYSSSQYKIKTEINPITHDTAYCVSNIVTYFCAPTLKENIFRYGLYKKDTTYYIKGDMEGEVGDFKIMTEDPLVFEFENNYKIVLYPFLKDTTKYISSQPNENAYRLPPIYYYHQVCVVRYYVSLNELKFLANNYPTTIKLFYSIQENDKLKTGQIFELNFRLNLQYKRFIDVINTFLSTK